MSEEIMNIGSEEGDQVLELDINRLRTFKNHPFKVTTDMSMVELKDSIEKYGILNPLIVRPVPEGYYEIISGHRRKFATKQLGYTKVPVIIKVMKNDEAIVAMVDSNLQREYISLITVAGFLAEVGDVRRFESPRQIQKLAGLSLRENSSGKHKGQTTISKRGRSKLRAVLFNAAIPLIAKNPEFRSLHEYYTTRANNPLKKKQSVIAISCKLIRVFYAILANGVIYDPEKMISDIHRPSQAA